MSQQVLQCPKCRGTMRSYERNGIHIEQCDNCRGIFLDHGELETLARVEAQWQAPPPPAPAPPPPPPHAAPPPPPPPGWGYQQQPGYGPGYGHGYGKHGKHNSFMKMLFSS